MGLQGNRYKECWKLSEISKTDTSILCLLGAGDLRSFCAKKLDNDRIEKNEK